MKTLTTCITGRGQISIKMSLNNIPLGMFLSVEKSAKKIMASHRDASFSIKRRIPTGCENGGKRFATERCIPNGMQDQDSFNVISLFCNPVNPVKKTEAHSSSLRLCASARKK